MLKLVSDGSGGGTPNGSTVDKALGGGFQDSAARSCFISPLVLWPS